MSDSEDDLFEKSFGNLKVIEEEEDKQSSEEEEIKEVKPKKERKKRVMTPEAKERLLENLKKGRETAKINRQKKAQVKKIKKQKEVIEIDETLLNHAKKNNKEKELLEKIEELQSQLIQKKAGGLVEKTDKKEKKEDTKKVLDTVFLNEAVEKQTPKKPINSCFNSYWD